MKDLKDKAIEYAYKNRDLIPEMAIRAYIAGATEAMQWHDAIKELPQDGEHILIYYRTRDGLLADTKYHHLIVDYEDKNGFELFEENMKKWHCQVLYWLPLPQFPKPTEQ